MTFTIDFGWWLLPALVTLVAYIAAFRGFSSGGGDYSFHELWNGILLLLAAVPSLIAWLIWALLA